MLYSKKYKEFEKSLDGCMLFTRKALDAFISWNSRYDDCYCIDVNVINKILNNVDGYFDFTKKMIDIGGGVAEHVCCLPFVGAYLFEPDKECLWNCHANLLNHDKCDTTETFQVALSDTEGKCEVLTNNGNYRHIVPCKTLDSYNLCDIGFIKIDVEGMEENVIRGGIETIKRNGYPPVQFECFNAGNFDMTEEKRNSLFGLIESLGYHIFVDWGSVENHLAVHKTKLVN